MVGRETIRVLGRSPFYDMALTCSGQLSYLGTSWRKDVAFAGYGVPLQGDMSAGKMIFGVEGADPARRSRLIQLLGASSPPALCLPLCHSRPSPLTPLSSAARARAALTRPCAPPPDPQTPPATS